MARKDVIWKPIIVPEWLHTEMKKLLVYKTEPFYNMLSRELNITKKGEKRK